jgi:signal transduction histidine kinase
VTLPVKSKSTVFALLHFYLNDTEAFSPYLPFLKNFANMLGVVFEASRQQALNEELMAELEERVALRTRELEEKSEELRRSEAQLQQSQKLESLGVLAGGIAHDFNNLMAGIYGYLDLALDMNPSEEIAPFLHKAMSSIDRARGLTGQLLTFARGGAPIPKVDDLFPFVEEVARFSLSGANVSCHFDIPSELWACNFDKKQIGQVIENLIINATQAMPDGGAIQLRAVNVTVHQDRANLSHGKYVQISVRDEGVGIPQEILPRIFEPFFTTKDRGHGIGLATCYSIVKRHGGCIEVESTPGRGTTFHVFLPEANRPGANNDPAASKDH